MKIREQIKDSTKKTTFGIMKLLETISVRQTMGS